MFKRRLTYILFFILIFSAVFMFSSCGNKIKMKGDIKINFLSEEEYLSDNYAEVLKTRQKNGDVSNNQIGPDQKIFVVIDLDLSRIKRLDENFVGNLSIAFSSDFGSDFDYNVEDFPTSEYSTENNAIKVPFKIRDGKNNSRSMRFILSLKKHTGGDIKITPTFSFTPYYYNEKDQSISVSLNGKSNIDASASVMIDEDIYPDSLLEYRLSTDGSYYIVAGVGAEITDKIRIPVTHNGIPVKEIDSYAFSDVNYVKNVLMYEGLEKIGDHAFNGCVSVDSFVIPSSVSHVGSNAFANCKNTMFWCVSPSKPNGWSDDWTGENLGVIWNSSELFSQSDNKTYSFTFSAEKINSDSLIIPENYLGYSVTRIVGGSESRENENITYMVISSGVREIGDYAFYNFRGLNNIKFNAKSCKNVNNVFTNAGENVEGLSVTFGNSVNTIPGGLFAGSYVKNIDFGKTARIIGDSAFKGCTGITELTIPNSIATVGIYAFSGCTSIDKVYISDIANWCSITFSAQHLDGAYNQYTDNNPLQYADELYVNGVKVTEITVPSGITSLLSYVFCEFRGLTSITLPDTVTYIGEKAFYKCSSLSSVNIPSGVTMIDKNAFRECVSLKNLDIPNSVETVETFAFYGCTGLTSVYVNAGSIKDSAFQKCTSLYSAEIGASVTHIGKYVFEGCSSLSSLKFNDKNNWYMGNVKFEQDVKDASTNAKVFRNSQAWSSQNSWYKK